MFLFSCATSMASPLERIGFEPPLRERLPPGIVLRDEHGSAQSIPALADGRPAVLVPVYYDCPNLCSATLAGLAAGLRGMDLEAGRDFAVLVFSIDPDDRADESRTARQQLTSHHSIASGWQLLHADAADIRALADAIGFRYFYDERQQQYAHAAGLVVLDPQGRLTHYFPGVRFEPRDLRLALLDAGNGRVGTVTQRLLLSCYDYDPTTGRYTLQIVRLVRIAALATALLLAGAIATWLYRERRARRNAGGGD